MSLLPILILSVLGAGLVLNYLYRWYTLRRSREAIKRQHGCLPPPYYPHKDPFLGIDLFIADNAAVEKGTFLETQKDRFRKYGNTLAENMFGTDLILTCEPENIKSILATDFESYCLGMLRSRSFTPLMGNSIFSVDGKMWEHSRAFLRPNFVRQQYESADMFERHITNLIAAIPRGETVDLQALLQSYTLDAATDFLFGESTFSLLPDKSTDGAQFATWFYEAQFECGQMFRKGPLILLPTPKAYKEKCARCHRWIDVHVHRALQNKNRRGGPDEKDEKRFVLLDEVIKETDDPVRLRSEMMSLLIAGRDSTAASISSLWFVLARRPDVVQKLRKEVDELNGERPTFERLKSMKYLQYTIQEGNDSPLLSPKLGRHSITHDVRVDIVLLKKSAASGTALTLIVPLNTNHADTYGHIALRVYAPVPLNNREAVKDTVLPVGGGPDGKSPVFVKKGQNLFYSVNSMHRRTDLWGPDAEEFKPERWENRKAGWEYLPFNGGPRLCLGQQFAITEVGYTTVRLLQVFKFIEPRDPTPWTERLALVCAVGNGVKVAMS